MKNRTDVTKNRVELLAPAGDFACFMAAVSGGADAVYLGGKEFGARAYAENFSYEEILEAIRIAHLLGRKIYLTVNTLMKHKEAVRGYVQLFALYEAGLDGVIVQDLGGLAAIRDMFPRLAVHASTQMNITGVYGAGLLKQLGVRRVVPARELSLEEVADIVKQTGLEVECFIHGAMCYSYSGQCLFSSILGGRSGNRGRCAGPCRLPYAGKDGKPCYPLSLKDLYTLDLLPKLIGAGITSFKIEGRMKKPEYVAGVTAVYRKYIDAYYEGRDTTPTREDEELLRGLYIRSDLCGGYYEKHNGKDMITMREPCYRGSDQETLAAVKQKYMEKKPTAPIRGEVYAYAGNPVKLTLSAGETSVSVEGGMAKTAVSRPLTELELSERLSKLGDTYFSMEQLTVHTDHQSFLPVKALNELRRNACAALETAILSKQKRSDLPKQQDDGLSQELWRERYKEINSQKEAKKAAKEQKRSAKHEPAALVTTKEQLAAALSFEELSLVYVNADILIRNGQRDLETEGMLRAHDRQYFLALPHILRKRSYSYLAQYQGLLESGLFVGVLARNFEELGWLNEIDYQGQRISDFGVYAWNTMSLIVYGADFKISRATLPVELNKKELSPLLSEPVGIEEKELLIYGRLPLMYSANCVQNTLKQCINSPDSQTVYPLTDRYKKIFPVALNCRHCYNIVYNTVPLSLHGQLDGIQKSGFSVLRMDFTIEDAERTRRIIGAYLKGLNGEECAWDALFAGAFTNGHYKRGVE